MRQAIVFSGGESPYPNCTPLRIFYRILGTNPITGLIREEQHDYYIDVGIENAYLVSPGGIYEANTRHMSRDGNCVHEERCYYSCTDGDFKRITEAELLGLLQIDKNAAHMVDVVTSER